MRKFIKIYKSIFVILIFCLLFRCSNTTTTISLLYRKDVQVTYTRIFIGSGDMSSSVILFYELFDPEAADLYVKGHTWLYYIGNNKFRGSLTKIYVNNKSSRFHKVSVSDLFIKRSTGEIIEIKGAYDNKIEYRSLKPDASSDLYFKMN